MQCNDLGYGIPAQRLKEAPACSAGPFAMHAQVPRPGTQTSYTLHPSSTLTGVCVVGHARHPAHWCVLGTEGKDNIYATGERRVGMSTLAEAQTNLLQQQQQQISEVAADSYVITHCMIPEAPGVDDVVECGDDFSQV